MFRHVVMFRWIDDITDEAKAQISAGLDTMIELDCVAEYAHGPDAGISDGNWDYVAVGTFASVEDYQTYAAEPGHVELIVTSIKPNIAQRVAVQYFIA